MNMLGFTAEASLYKSDEPHRVSRLDFDTIGQVTPQQNANARVLLCARAWDDCVTYGICDYYFANCTSGSGGGGVGGGGDGGGGGSRRGPIHFA
jgi:hypothetical protein